MKSLFRFAMIASAVIAAAACNKVVEAPESPLSQGEKITLSASRENLASGTKTVLQNDLSVWWSTNEELSVFFGPGSAGGSKFTSQNTEASATTDFDGTVETTGVDPESKYWAVYPYLPANTCDGTSVQTVIPARQIAVEGNFADNGIPAVAESSSLSLSFKNICGALKFSLTRDDITSVTFKGNGTVSLAGTVKVEMDTEGLPALTVVSGEDAVVLATADGSPLKSGVFYYMNVLPTALASGFTMTFETPSGTGVFVTDKNLAVKRSVVSLIRNADSYATFVPSVSLKDFAVEFIKGLQVWEETVGNIDADGVRNQYSAKGAWENVHFIPIVGNTASDYYNYGNNQYDGTHTPWVLNVAGTEYSSNEAWEIAIRGLLEMCTAEGQAFLDGMTDRNKAYTLQDGMDISMIPIPATSPNNKWGKHPWYEAGNLVKDGGADIAEVDLNFMVKVCSWHVVRGLIKNAGNSSPLGMIGNYQEFGTSSSTLILGNYKGYISPMRELLVLMRIYKYIVDNAIDSNVYTAIKDQKFSFDLYGDSLVPPGPTVTPFKTQWDFCATSALDETTGYVNTFSGGAKYDSKGAFDGGESVRDNTAGDGGLYVDANKLGSGRITFVQIDKTEMDTNPESPIAGRNVGSTGHPYQTGTWKGDYWLITATNGNLQPAGAKAHIKFITRASKTGVKYWIAEYFDGNEWKPAPLEVLEEGYTYAEPQNKTVESDVFTYNVVMKNDGKKNTTVESSFTLAADLTELQFRLRAVGLYKAQDDAPMTALSGCTSRIAGSTEASDGTTSSPVFEVIE